MTLIRTRIILSAAVFAANLALSLSYGTAEAQTPRHIVGQVSRQHHMALREPLAGPAGAPSLIMMPMSAANPSCDVPWYCDFPTVNPS